jgi:hypothetical protein
VKFGTAETYGVVPEVRSGGTVRLRVDRLDLLPGTYYLNFGLTDGGLQVDLVEEAMQLEVTARAVYPTGRLPPASTGYVMFAPCSWTFSYGSDEKSPT